MYVQIMPVSVGSAVDVRQISVVAQVHKGQSVELSASGRDRKVQRDPVELTIGGRRVRADKWRAVAVRKRILHKRLLRDASRALLRNHGCSVLGRSIGQCLSVGGGCQHWRIDLEVSEQWGHRIDCGFDESFRGKCSSSWKIVWCAEASWKASEDDEDQT